MTPKVEGDKWEMYIPAKIGDGHLFTSIPKRHSFACFEFVVKSFGLGVFPSKHRVAFECWGYGDNGSPDGSIKGHGLQSQISHAVPRFHHVFAAFQCQVQAVKCSFFAWSWWKSLEMALLACFVSPVAMKRAYIYTLLCQPRIAKVPLFIPHFDPFCSHSVSLALKFLQCQWCWARKGACNQVWSQVTRELRVTALGCGLRDQWDCHAWGTVKAYGWLLGQLTLFQRAWMWLNEADRRYASISEKSRENESG